MRNLEVMIHTMHRVIIFNKRGFSLLELLICVCIISIISTIALVAYHGAVDSAAIKTGLPGVLDSLNVYSKAARDEEKIITVEFLLGTSKIRVTRDSGTGEPTSKVVKIGGDNLLKKKLVFRKYKWPDGAHTPASFTFFPKIRPSGGKVTFGTAFAEAEIWLMGDRVVSNF